MNSQILKITYMRHNGEYGAVDRAIIKHLDKSMRIGRGAEYPWQKRKHYGHEKK